jgi:hypothetical protein
MLIKDSNLLFFKEINEVNSYGANKAAELLRV